MFWGLALVFVGVVLLLDQLDVLHDGFSKLWPVLVILLGLAILTDRFRRSSQR